MVRGSARARYGLRLFRARPGRCCFSAVEQFSHSKFRLAPCAGICRLACHDRADSSGHFRYALRPGRSGPFTGWGHWWTWLSYDRGIRKLFLTAGRGSVCDSHYELLVYPGGINRGHWRHRRGDPTFHLVSEGCRLFRQHVVAILYGSAGGQPGRPRTGGLLGGSLSKERRHGVVLRHPERLSPLAQFCAVSRGDLGLRGGFWFLDGSGLHADPAGCRGMFWDRLTRETAGSYHNGLFVGTVGGTLARWQNFRR